MGYKCFGTSLYNRRLLLFGTCAIGEENFLDQHGLAVLDLHQTGARLASAREQALVLGAILGVAGDCRPIRQLQGALMEAESLGHTPLRDRSDRGPRGN